MSVPGSSKKGPVGGGLTWLTSKPFFTDGYYTTLRVSWDIIMSRGQFTYFLCLGNDSLNHKRLCQQEPSSLARVGSMLSQEGWNVSTTQRKARSQKLGIALSYREKLKGSLTNHSYLLLDSFLLLLDKA